MADEVTCVWKLDNRLKTPIYSASKLLFKNLVYKVVIQSPEVSQLDHSIISGCSCLNQMDTFEKLNLFKQYHELDLNHFA